jgi:hypothetical protein
MEFLLLAIGVAKLVQGMLGVRRMQVCVAHANLEDKATFVLVQKCMTVLPNELQTTAHQSDFFFGQ